MENETFKRPGSETIDLSVYDNSTLKNKEKLRGNPACVINEEADSNRILVRNEWINEGKRFYVYNSVDRENRRFTAEEGSFNPYATEADQLDEDIDKFLKNFNGDINSIQTEEEARLAVLSGTISRKQYLEIKNKKLEIKRPPELDPREILEKYTRVDEAREIEFNKFYRYAESFNKLITSSQPFERIAEDLLYIKRPAEDVFKSLNTYLNNKEVNISNFQKDRSLLTNQISELKKLQEQTDSEEERNNLKEQIRNLEEVRMQLENVRTKYLTSIESSLKNFDTSTFFIKFDQELRQRPDVENFLGEIKSNVEEVRSTMDRLNRPERK